jgi:hypothetical protein
MKESERWADGKGFIFNTKQVYLISRLPDTNYHGGAFWMRVANITAAGKVSYLHTDFNQGKYI